MKNYIAKRFQNISGGLSLDTEALSRYSDVIDMSIGDTDFITDSRIIDAAFSDARLGYTQEKNECKSKSSKSRKGKNFL